MQITCGCNTIPANLAEGKTISEVALSFPQLAVPAKRSLIVNGEERAESEYVVVATDDIWLMPPSKTQGVKAL